ncbi:MAG: hypothetical protein B1H08_01790 [Candidatus Omnitrophica bacterium 4484_171]|nr:MAG: hypothetical protein B1H08_01790 [Candidatus Omnitrophica bacterium 4484_171]
MILDYKNIFEAFLAAYNKYPSKDIIYYKKDKNYAHLTYKGLYKQIESLSSFLLENNIKKGDKVAIVIDNGPSWPIAFLGLMRIGAVAVPMNHKLEYEEIELFLRHSESKIVLTSINVYPRIKHAAESVSINTLAVDFEQTLKGIDTAKKYTAEETTPDDLALIIYTSGTTQAPKGVMLTHKNILANVESLKKLKLMNENDCIIALLPFYHAYPLMVTMLLPLLSGARISFPLYYDFQEIMECMKKTGVTIFVGVPRIFNLLHQKIKKTIKSLFVAKRLLLILLLKTVLPLRKYTGINLAKFIIVDLHSRFGRKLRFMISGGAKLNRNIAYDFYSWGFTVLEGYGLTETSPVVSFNTPGEYRIGSAGRPIPDVQIKIDSEDGGKGEIFIKGDNVSKGYYKEEDLTVKAYKDGWFLSGDLGFMDKNGFLYLEGRKKEIIVLSSGKNINPYDLENYYLKSVYIEEICVFLSKDPSGNQNILSAVIVPDYKQFRTRHIQQVKDRIRFEIENLSRRLPSYKRIKKYTITSNKLPRTEIGKIKRYKIEQEYSSFVTAEKTTHIKSDDKYLLNSPICRKAMNYLKESVGRPVHLDDHLELDLGLDSLEQIGLLLGFQKVTGIRINDEDALDIFTVRDALMKLYLISSRRKPPPGATSTQWQDILYNETPVSIIKSIRIHQNALEKIINFFTGAAVAFLCRVIFALRVKNKYNIPKDTPYILSPNHTSFLDGIIIAGALWPSVINRVYFLGYSGYFERPYIRWATKLFRFVSIDPVMHLVETMQACAYILRNEKILCMFPEGVRSPDGTIKNFKKGIGIIAKELNIPIVPVYIKGAFKAWPRHRILPRPAKVTVTFGKKITVDKLAREKDENIDIYQNIANNLRKIMIELAKNS